MVTLLLLVTASALNGSNLWSGFAPSPSALRSAPGAAAGSVAAPAYVASSRLGTNSANAARYEVGLLRVMSLSLKKRRRRRGAGLADLRAEGWVRAPTGRGGW